MQEKFLLLTTTHQHLLELHVSEHWVKDSPMAKMSTCKMYLVVLALIVYSITMVLNALAGRGSESGLFLQSIGNVSKNYSTEITPAGWTFSIWGVIYIWQAVWLVYVCSGLCRRNALTWMPSVLSCQFYIVWIINNLLNIGWIFLWDREYIIPALIFLALIAFTSYVVLYLSYRALHTQRPWMQKYQKVDLWLVRILVQNGLTVYATWTTIATLINFAVVLTYSGGITVVTSGTVSLSILAFEVVLWFNLENLLFDKYVRYTLTVYPVIIVALSGSLDKNYNSISPTRNNIYIAVLLAAACAAFAARVVIVTWRHFKRPLHQNVEN
ncbi:uncharacterized protein si:ch211-161h7.5 isoform X1 [Carcharodon carcharias]|uniref:uncharacterized protein si:ch211-161h7.5 isoform X1 n=2 Tax=Carcharodon carcharias TaxID=13397 RepID=UPI001B7E3FE1|nr:uncharacterized protein si:ch211-161h7.5 isoform X1 [Carcharodon carcharias]